MTKMEKVKNIGTKSAFTPKLNNAMQPIILQPSHQKIIEIILQPNFKG